MAKTYLIDVFNLLHQIPETKSLMNNNKLLDAEILFLNQVLNFVNSSNCRCILFFDGRNPELTAKWNSSNLRVIFCHPQTADDKIKEHLKNLYGQRSQKGKTITVSDDHAILSNSRRYDIKTMNSNSFISMLNNSEETSSSENRSQEKPDTPTEAEIDEYMKLLAEDTRKKQAGKNE